MFFIISFKNHPYLTYIPPPSVKKDLCFLLNLSFPVKHLLTQYVKDFIQNK